MASGAPVLPVCEIPALTDLECAEDTEERWPPRKHVRVLETFGIAMRALAERMSLGLR
jgi:hypothetical protein